MFQSKTFIIYFSIFLTHAHNVFSIFNLKKHYLVQNEILLRNVKRRKTSISK